jgi:hypothetical protein
MRTLTQREQRTIRLAAAAVAIYFVVFLGVRGCKSLETKRSDYQQLLVNAQRLKRDLQPYENRVLLAQKLKDSFRMDPQKLSRASLVAEASAAIQNAAKSGGIQLGPIRESPARTSAKELTSMQLEGNGSVSSVMTLLHRLETVGYPLIIDSVQIAPDSKPGKVKVNLTIVILDYEQWKKEEAPRA